MVGSALERLLRLEGFQNVLVPSREELDLRSRGKVQEYFDCKQPDYVFMAAAHVGGIAANMADPVRFLSDNTRMQENLFEACWQFRTQRNVFIGSSCVYPRNSPQPIREEFLLRGELEPTNEAYALAKIVGLKLAQYYWEQHGMLTVCPMPCNIYGTNDHFDDQRAHVLSSLVRRFVDARNKGRQWVTIWGTGKPRREFLHVEDAARAILFLMERHHGPDIVNVGSGEDITILELAGMIGRAADFKGNIRTDPTKPDGMQRKCLDITKIRDLGWRPGVGLEEGIRRTVREYERLSEREVANEY